MSAPSRQHLAVTGASGFLGGAVVRAAVARGHHVTAIARRPLAALPDGVSAAVADLATPGAVAPHLAGVDTVVHCAASLGGDAATQQRDTIDATRELLTAARAAGVRRCVLLSSFAVYDVAALDAGARLDERTPLARDADVRGPYIAAKLAQEALVTAATGLETSIVRPGLVFGPGRTWFYHLGLHLHPRLWVSLAGSATLPLTYVDNCADAVVAAAERAPAGLVVNVVDHELPTRRTYLAALAGRAHPSPVVVDLPWGALRAGATMANRLGVSAGMLHPSRLAARCQPLTYTNEVAGTALDWRPRVAMADAIARSLA